MPGITGMGTTYNLPNYVGELHNASPEDTPLLSAIGGLTGGESVGATLFQWQEYDLRDAADDRQRTEGADAPSGDARARVNVSNVVEIHQEAVSLSYTRGAIRRQQSTGGQPAVQIGGAQIPADEMAFQIEAQIKQKARDIEKTFITGEYQNPTSNASPRKTRGLLEAITTNVAAVEESDFDSESILDLMQAVWDEGGIQEGETRTIIVNSTLKRQLTKLFVTDKNYEESTRNVGGVNLQFIETDFGRCNIMLNRYVPVDTLIVASLDQLAPAYLEIPGKGHFFVEPLAKTGASDKVQLYGEIGLKYGLEKRHGKLVVTEDEQD